ncbi:ABC transporter ATP-binding protein [Brassicibacter mesophilus]|uniref:ABC transporter ATP-binding protein n=1 Tax=Brassicibacter mesophilus TaxID=745119 RepID=UPI003D24EDAF
MISISNLSVEYKNKDKCVKALHNINLEIEDGQICAIIGPSGGGKSTLLKVLAGIIRDYEGQALINNKPVDPKNNRIGFIPQNYGLIEWKTVKKNILLSKKIKDGKHNFDSDMYYDIIKKLGIEECVKRYPKQLSGGQRQRVSLARAFLLAPELILMDEPFSALDALTREEVQKMFMGIWKEKKVTTILVTHDINEAIYLGNKIAVFSPAPGTIVKIIDNPFFGKTCCAMNKEHGEMNKRLRDILKEVKNYEA